MCLIAFSPARWLGTHAVIRSLTDRRMPMEEARAGTISGARNLLEDIGLGRYADLFAQNQVDLDRDTQPHR